MQPIGPGPREAAATAPEMQAVHLMTDGRPTEAIALARALREQAVSVPAVEHPDPAAVSQQLTASLIEVLALVSGRHPDALARALAFIDEAQAAGRSAWSAAGRAVAARIMRASSMTPDVLTMLALAELELEDEFESGLVLDPPGGPTGPGAAANNLGAIYDDLGLMDRAQHHLEASVRASADHYGVTLRDQVCVDRVNLMGFWLARALDSEADGAVDRAAYEAELGLHEVDEIQALSDGMDWASLIDWARILQLGCVSVADPDAAGEPMRDEVRDLIDGSAAGSVVRNVTAYLVLARLCRLSHDADGAVEAAQQASRHYSGSTSLELSRVWREASLAVAEPGSPTLAYARSLQLSLNENRNDLATALDQRIEMLRLERRHADVRIAREHLEEALAEAKAVEARLKQAASRDHLTGLLNRSSLLDVMTVALDFPSDGPGGLAVVFMDLDGFKQVNDQHGHAAGDRLLLATADALRAVVREGDALARYGGDEFVCLRRNVRNRDDLQQWANRLCSAVEGASAAFQPPVAVSASLGVCLFDDPTGWTAEGAIARADAAMYEAKRRGPGQVHVETLPSRDGA